MAPVVLVQHFWPKKCAPLHPIWGWGHFSAGYLRSIERRQKGLFWPFGVKYFDFVKIMSHGRPKKGIFCPFSALFDFKKWGASRRCYTMFLGHFWPFGVKKFKKSR